VKDIHTVQIDLNWDLFATINRLERFEGSWNAIAKTEGRTLKELKSIATVRSVGASTRIEGSKLTDEEVDHLLQFLNIQKLTERDTQEVVGYFEVLELITSSSADIMITENSIKDLHNRILKFSEKDEWHRGDYKQHPNHVEATLPDGSKQIIFQTTPPGFPTDDAMRSLLEWYHSNNQAHPLIKCAVFVYEFLSIHPFQDGNGRLSRLLATLLLMKNGFTWIQYISFEHEIENRKTEYYAVLRACQNNRPHEEVTPWVHFFLNCIDHLQQLLMDKLQSSGAEAALSPRVKSILVVIRERPGIQSGELAQRLGIPIPTVKRILTDLVNQQLIQKKGIGRGTSYQVK
jgi:Fic family protein